MYTEISFLIKCIILGDYAMSNDIVIRPNNGEGLNLP